MPQKHFYLTRTAGLWLVNFSTKLVRLATGQDWHPLGMTSLFQTKPGYLDFIGRDKEMPTEIKEWIGGLVIIAKAVAGIIAFQYEPDELIPALEQADETDFIVGLNSVAEVDLPNLDEIDMV